ncbi:MAG: alpha/beta hydrolase [Deltaproteobacteria bacterium]|nr:alpha/beta hydrolase [Deltaproteobacteria bacterium]
MPQDPLAEETGIPMIQRQIAGYDGTMLHYRIRRSGPRWLVIANGYAGTFLEWKSLLPRLDPRLSILMWDYRGTYRSAVPNDRSHLTILDDSLDLDAIVETEGIDRFVLMGWSVGVQVALEQYRQHPERIEALILHNGSPERVLHNVLDGNLAPRLFEPITGLLAKVGNLFHPVRRVLHLTATARLLEVMGVVVRHEPHFREAVRSVAELDLDVYFTMVMEADRHRTNSMWHQVHVPTLITYGKRDFITPERVARALHRSIAGSRLAALPGGHYSLMEYPELLATNIGKFLDQLGAPTESGHAPLKYPPH